jgi:hypothetical protein
VMSSSVDAFVSEALVASGFIGTRAKLAAV